MSEEVAENNARMFANILKYAVTHGVPYLCQELNAYLERSRENLKELLSKGFDALEQDFQKNYQALQQDILRLRADDMIDDNTCAKLKQVTELLSQHTNEINMQNKYMCIDAIRAELNTSRERYLAGDTHAMDNLTQRVGKLSAIPDAFENDKAKELLSRLCMPNKKMDAFEKACEMAKQKAKIKTLTAAAHIISPFRSRDIIGDFARAR